MMSEKRFAYGETDLFEWVEDNGEMISTKECVNKLNELYEENKKLRNKLEVANARSGYYQRMLEKWCVKDE